MKRQKKGDNVNGPSITLLPPPYFIRNGHLFNNENSFPDLDFVIKGVRTPLKLHRIILTQTSRLVEEVLKGKSVGNSSDRNRIEWMFDTTKDIDQSALMKALRFCYGETVTIKVENGECCAMIAALYRLGVVCADEIVAKIIKFTVDEAKNDLRVGGQVLTNLQQYPECISADYCMLDERLTKVVLQRAINDQDYEIIVDGCLMKLPPKYLDMAKYGDSHTKWSEFTVRTRYIRYHSKTLSQKEKAEILRNCDWTVLRSQELKNLREIGVPEPKSLVLICESLLEFAEKDRDIWKTQATLAEQEKSEWKMRAMAMEKERNKQCERAEKAEKERNELREYAKKTAMELECKKIVKTCDDSTAFLRATNSLWFILSPYDVPRVIVYGQIIS